MLLLSRGPKIVVISKDDYALAHCGGRVCFGRPTSSGGQDLGSSIEALLQKKRRLKDSCILSQIGRQLHSQGEPTCDWHGNRYGWRSKGCPGRVHSGIAGVG